MNLYSSRAPLSQLTRRDNRYAHGAVEPGVVGGADDDVCRAVIYLVRYPGGRFVHLEQRQVFAAGDVHQKALRGLQVARRETEYRGERW